MPGGAGYPFNFEVNGVASSWKNIEFSDDNAGNDVSSRLAPDGTVNQGYSDRDSDLGTATITLTECARAAGDDRGSITDAVFGFPAGTRDGTLPWAYYYDGILMYSGTGLYFASVGTSGSIPGEGRVTCRLQAVGAYSRA
jgi:hypothetical protein